MRCTLWNCFVSCISRVSNYKNNHCLHYLYHRCNMFQAHKKLLKTYETVFNHIFWDDYKEHMMEGIKHLWDSLAGPKQTEEEKTEQNKK